MRLFVALCVVIAVAGCEKSAGPPRKQAPVAEAAPPIAAVPATTEVVAEAAPAGSVPAEAYTPGPREFEEIMQRAVAMFTAMGEVAAANPNDCAKLAAGIDQVMIDFKGLIAQARRFKDNPAVDKMGEEWMKKHQNEVMGPMMKLADAGQRCASNAAFMATMERLAKLGD